MDYENDTDFLDDCSLELNVDLQRISVFLLYLFMFIAGLALNVTVLWVNWQRRRSRNTVIFCTLNMAVADLALMTMLPISMLESILDHVWIWGDFLCRFSNLLIMLNIYASCFFLAYMSVERYYALVRGSAPKTGGVPEKRKRALFCGGLWVFALFLSTLETVHIRVIELNEPGCYVWPEHAYLEWYKSLIIIHFLMQFLIPAVIITTSNALLARAVRSSPEVQSQKTEDVWILHAHSAVFIACWLPFQITMLLVLVDISHQSFFDCVAMKQLFLAYTVLRAVTQIHCLFNPVLYSLLSRSFRNKLFSLVLSRLRPYAVHDQPGNPDEGKGGRARANHIAEQNTSQSEG